MELEHNKTKWTKIYWDLGIIITVFVLIFSVQLVKPMIHYRCGLTLSVSWYKLLYSLAIPLLLSMGLILILIIRLAVLNIRFGIKRLLLQIVFIIAAIGLFRMPPIFNQIIPGFKEGFYENMKANADIVTIQDWLNSFDWDSFEKQKKPQPRDWDSLQKVLDYSLSIYLHHDSWPDAIKELPDFPKQRVIPMKSANNKIYVRVAYGGGWAFGHVWSLVVGVGADEIPLDEYLETEERLELAPNAFVGYAWKR